jgi:arabinofuranosyltransferase
MPALSRRPVRNRIAAYFWSPPHALTMAAAGSTRHKDVMSSRLHQDFLRKESPRSSKIADMEEKGLSAGVFLLLLVFGIVLVRTAWLCDDAYITFRTVDNFINGYGLTWNVAERVQAYTHPLWMFLLSAIYFFTREIYYSSTFPSLVLSLAAAGLVALRLASSKTAALLALSVFFCSRAFVDYSTSGLENPLTHLILALFLLLYVRPEPLDYRKLFLLSFIAALGMLNRMDVFLLFLPPLTCLLWQLRGAKGLAAMGLGFLPFLLWEGFSLFYYGFLFPNTAYAKLNTGIPANELLVQGFSYLQDSLQQDPVTLPVIAAGALTPLLLKQWKLMPLSIGMLLYVLYVVKIGGDFMSGRFLAAPLLVGVAILSRICWRPKFVIPAVAAVWTLGFFSPYPPLLTGGSFGADYTDDEKQYNIANLFKKTNGISDERRFYYQDTSLLNALIAGKKALQSNILAQEGARWRKRGKALFIIDAIGFFGFFAGPDLHIIDPPALADPLLARLPAGKAEKWRIGHFVRIIPNGYTETLESGQNLICDEKLAGYYNMLSLLTRGDLFAFQRLKEIWNMNTGKYDHLIAPDIYRGLDVAHNKKGLAEYSVKELLPVVDRNPDDAYAQYKLGIAYARSGLLEQAIAHLENAVKLHPEDRCMRRDLAQANKVINRME